MKWLILTSLLSLNLFAANNEKALLMALDDEYKARATYLQVMQDFGEVRPFVNIARSEQRHIDALKPFFQKYGLDIPENPYVGNIPSYNSLKEACQAGVDAEVANVALYDQIYALTDDQDLIAVFNRLQWASDSKHLPAFKRCANGGQGRGQGHGGGQGRGRGRGRGNF